MRSDRPTGPVRARRTLASLARGARPEPCAADGGARARGERDPDVGGAEYFHTAGYTFPYDNMHYIAVKGGNAFYWKS